MKQKMELFDSLFDTILRYQQKKNDSGLVKTYSYNEKISWPKTGNSHVIFEENTAIELGHPQTGSLAFMLWTESPGRVNDERITVIGPDLHEIKERQSPFGKIMLLRCHGFNEENTRDRYTELDMLRHQLRLKDYMLRAISQDMIEWSRISRRGMKAGFSFQVLGTELIREYKKPDYVDEAEIIFITSGEDDLQEIKPVAEKTSRVIEAMNSIFDNLELDCAACSFQDICDEIDGLREMHRAEIR